jgi:hypothetical protein
MGPRALGAAPRARGVAVGRFFRAGAGGGMHEPSVDGPGPRSEDHATPARRRLTAEWPEPMPR